MRQARSLIIFAVRTSPTAHASWFFGYWTNDRGIQIYKRRFERNGYDIDAYVQNGRELHGITENAIPARPLIPTGAIIWHNVPRHVKRQYQALDDYFSM